MNMILEAEIDALREKVIAVEKDNEFMKKLIFHANENYEALEKKCMLLESKAMLNTDCKSAKKSSIDNLQKSSVTKKNSHSPSMS